MRNPILGILSSVLVLVIMWSGVVTGGGVIETPVFDSVALSLLASFLLLDIFASILAVVMIVTLLVLVQMLLGNSILGIILQVVVALGSLVPATFLALRWFGNWLGFFPAYPSDTAWFISVCVTGISIMVALFKRKD